MIGRCDVISNSPVIGVGCVRSGGPVARSTLASCWTVSPTPSGASAGGAWATTLGHELGKINIDQRSSKGRPFVVNSADVVRLTDHSIDRIGARLSFFLGTFSPTPFFFHSFSFLLHRTDRQPSN